MSLVTSWADSRSKGSAVRRLKWHASWVQNVVRQFGPISIVGVRYLMDLSLVREDRDGRTNCAPVVRQEHGWVAKYGRDKR